MVGGVGAAGFLLDQVELRVLLLIVPALLLRYEFEIDLVDKVFDILKVLLLVFRLVFAFFVIPVFGDEIRAGVVF